MDTLERLNHSVWDCKYHVVFIPKYRRKALYAELRRYLGDVFKKLATLWDALAICASGSAPNERRASSRGPERR